ncbi:cysteine-rich VLP domain-containing protein [Ruminococcus difficilis]|uniref:Cysteine-rich VLP domain-containing protein n=1 Tax=Ruminococcus difficilis TaxID=2763069 RepID=A0A934TZJ2_9FIRM|nr:cysteine-rich VLP domain-containing protein [Ruminococcus difficilis]
MNLQQYRQVKKMIKRFCANYQDGYCLPLDDGEPCVCVQSISFHICCNYFRKAVLPNSPSLEAQLLNQDMIFYCMDCNKPFIPTSKRNNQKYCAECAKRRHRRSAAESLARARRKC